MYTQQHSITQQHDKSSLRKSSALAKKKTSNKNIKDIRYAGVCVCSMSGFLFPSLSHSTQHQQMNLFVGKNLLFLLLAVSLPFSYKIFGKLDIILFVLSIRTNIFVTQQNTISLDRAVIVE